jgi:hypothetical protein
MVLKKRLIVKGARGSSANICPTFSPPVSDALLLHTPKVAACNGTHRKKAVSFSRPSFFGRTRSFYPRFSVADFPGDVSLSAHRPQSQGRA